MTEFGRPRILLAEADEAIASALAKVLQTAGYDVRVAGEGCSAAAQLALGSLDLLLIDLDTFSDESSLFCQTLRVTEVLCPLVLLSGSPTRGLREEAGLVGALLDKPTDADSLLEQISHLLGVGADREASGPRVAAMLEHHLGPQNHGSFRDRKVWQRVPRASKTKAGVPSGPNFHTHKNA